MIVARRRWGVGILTGALLSAVSGAAHADATADCNTSLNSPAKIEACTSIITDTAATAEQKASAFRNRANVRADAGASEQAETDFSEAITLKPDDAAALSGRARVRLTRNNMAGAIEDFSAAVTLKPANPAFFVGRGYAYFLKGDADAAVADFSEAIQLDPKNASAFNHRGLAYRKKGDLEKAIGDFTTAITLNPAYALAYNNRGYVYESKGSKAEAIADFDKALMLDRSLTGAADGLKRLGAKGPLASEVDALIRGGKALVEGNCTRCHAVGNTGESPNPKAPPFRTLHERHPKLALRDPLSRGIAATHDEMPKFKLTDEDVDKIVAYINGLPDSAKK